MLTMLLAENSTMSLSATVALAVVATLGYLFGRQRQDSDTSTRDKTRHEIMRALGVAQELETIAYRLRKSMSFHVPAIVRFNSRIHRWERSSDISWNELCDEADELLKPALRLSTEISHAYADLLQQMTQLSAFAELSTDPLTGVQNRRAFDESLAKLMAERTDGQPLSIAMLDLDNFKKINDVQGHLAGDRVLRDLAQLLKVAMREADVLARYGGEEFVMIMPSTSLATACELAERIRARIEEKLPTTISIGVASLMPSESATNLIARADGALYAAKDQGRNCVCLHDGSSVCRSTPPDAGQGFDQKPEAGLVAPGITSGALGDLGHVPVPDGKAG